MPIDVRADATLTDTERGEIAAVRNAVYPPGAGAAWPGRHIEWASPERLLLVRDEAGRLVAHVGLVLRDGTHDGRPARIGGIGGVMTHPEARGRGYAGAGIAAAGAAFAADGADFGLLVCIPELKAYYGRFGWLPFGGTLLVAQHGQTVPFTFNDVMTRPVRGPAPVSGTIDLCGSPW